MPIELMCGCGRSLYLRDELAGTQIRCPDCRNVVSVPSSASPSAYERVEADDPASLPAVLPAYDALQQRSQEAATEFESEGGEMIAPPPRPRPAPASDGSGSQAAGIGGGLLMMVIGGAWSALSWKARGFPQPHAALLFIFGVVAFGRGIYNLSNRDGNGSRT